MRLGDLDRLGRLGGRLLEASGGKQRESNENLRERGHGHFLPCLVMRNRSAEPTTLRHFFQRISRSAATYAIGANVTSTSLLPPAGCDSALAWRTRRVEPFDANATSMIGATSKPWIGSISSASSIVMRW